MGGRFVGAGFVIGAAADCLCHRRFLADRLVDGGHAGVPATGWRVAGQHRVAGGHHRAPVHRPRGDVGLADRTHRSAGTALVVFAGDGTAGGTGVRAQLRLGQPGAADSRVVCRGTGFGHRLFSVFVLASGRHVAPTGPGHRRRCRIARAQALGGVFPGGVAATAPGDLRRRAAGGPASAGRIWPVRDDSLRYVHHGDLRSVQIHLQRRGRAHAGQRARPLLPGHADR
ncbi:hypothetical protein D3C86_802510 [compost metagenome]